MNDSTINAIITNFEKKRKKEKRKKKKERKVLIMVLTQIFIYSPKWI